MSQPTIWPLQKFLESVLNASDARLWSASSRVRKQWDKQASQDPLSGQKDTFGHGQTQGHNVMMRALARKLIW